MKIALLLSAALIPAFAAAEDPKPYIVNNGRGATTAPAPAPAVGGATANGILGTTTQASIFGSNAVHPTLNSGDTSPATIAAAAAAAATAGGGRGIRGMKGVMSKKRGAGIRRAAQADAPPPNFSKPGALIRTEGQLPTYTATNDARTTSVEGGTFISQDPRRTVDSNRGPGVTWGAPDKAPSANQGSGSGAGGSAIVANGPSNAGGGPSGTSPIHGDNGGGNGGQDNGVGNNNNNGQNGQKSKDMSSVSGFDPAF
ncbi:MAG: hypothetical protein ACHQ51_03600 [Elusimicrobiota bacterium]